ncbi:UNKNOWN [Stylonychia lemnae]|uniref:Uncharacterized protein n=1 Tax=Stylonychia lemnae TaxID=5949 RepID=A0A078AXU4_STYLE|nr:UNKNOWN [Stylonychia lemnae]|eukprot:CDW85618.1 UNKNOWN [Stylonychia lemnae]
MYYKILGSGLGCQSSNIKTGCEKCQGEQQNSGWVISKFSEYQNFQNQNIEVCQNPQLDSQFSKDIFCLIFDYQDQYNCIKCKDGFYINKNGFYNETASRFQDICSSYIQGEICLDADSFENCLICKYGYGLYLDENGNQKYTETKLPIQDQITACEDGYVDKTTGKCTAHCGLGRYGKMQFDSRGLIEASSCEICDDMCFECASQGECLSCKKGFYLYTGSSLKSTGKCLQKSGFLNLTLFVDSTNQQYSEEDLTGQTISDPFLSLQSAFIKAYEYGAPFESAEIKILLISGKTHSMIRYDNNHLLPKAYDQNSQSTKIIIDTTSGSQVTVLYKMRDQFKFLVGGGLEIRNIAFNAFDSIFDPRQGFDLSLLENQDYQCLKDHFLRCCRKTLDQSTGYTTVTGQSFCQQYVPIFMYDFNTLIELNDFGGYIEISRSLFDNMNSCGAIIRNKRFDQVYDKLIKNSDFLNYDLIQSIEYEKSKLPQQTPFDKVCGNSSQFIYKKCFEIVLSNSYVQYSNKLSNFSEFPLWVNPFLKMKNFGLIFDLDNFQARGPQFIDVYKNINLGNCQGYMFKYNQFQQQIGIQGSSGGSIYLECVNYQQVDDEPNGQIHLPQITFEQLRDLDSQDQFESVVFDGNSFSQNSASSGLGVLNVINFPRIKIINSIFFQNYDAFREIIANTAQYLYYPDELVDLICGEKFLDIYQNATYDERKLASSIIHIERSNRVYIQNIQVNTNMIIEPKFSNERACFFYFKDISESAQIISLQEDVFQGSYIAYFISYESFQDQDFSLWPLPGTKLRILQLVTSVKDMEIFILRIENWQIREIKFNQGEILSNQNYIGLSNTLSLNIKNSEFVDIQGVDEEHYFVELYSVLNLIDIQANNSLNINLNLANSTFNLIKLYNGYGGLLSIQQSNNNINSTNRGGLFKINAKESIKINLMDNVVISDFVVDNYGGVFFLQSKQVEIILDNVNIMNIKAKGVDNQIIGIELNAIYSIGQNNILMRNNKFQCSSGGNINEQFFNAKQFHLNSEDLEIINVRINNSLSLQDGGAFYIDSPKIALNFTNFEANQTISIQGNGGLMNILNAASLTANGLKLLDSFSSQKGHFIYCEAYTMNNIQSYQGGAIHIIGGHFECIGSNFSNNSAYNGGAMYFYKTSSIKLFQIFINQVYAFENGAAINIYNPLGNTKIRNCTIQDGYGKLFTGGIYYVDDQENEALQISTGSSSRRLEYDKQGKNQIIQEVNRELNIQNTPTFLLLELENVIFSELKGDSASVLYVQAKQTIVEINSCSMDKVNKYQFCIQVKFFICKSS